MEHVCHVAGSSIPRDQGRCSGLMSVHSELGKRPPLPLWTNRLWVLSAVLGAATLGSTAAIIHDTGRQRNAARLVAKSTADQIVATAAGRLEMLAL
jgi:hypothetical protein